MTNVPAHLPSYPCSREILTKYGPIVGRRLIDNGEKQVDAFQGIPYAKPPLGDLRFKKPVPPEPWIEVKECKKFGPRATQEDFFPGLEKILGKTSEDCLTLNVFSPVWESVNNNGFPVMVFIHGGAFSQDCAIPYGDINICQALVTKDVVVITLQYRLGFLGFWSTGDEHCPGNIGLWDITMALRWIKENISSFNGDPENVTLMGDSAGGAIADLLSLSPHSRDLFQKVICMSGSACVDWSLSFQTVETCQERAEEAGVSCFSDSQKLMEELRKLPASAFSGHLKIGQRPTETTLGPRIDGDFLPKHPSELRKEAPAKPRMIGICKEEGLLLVNGEGKASEVYKTAAILFPEKEFVGKAAELRREYVRQVLNTDETDKERIQRALVTIKGDWFQGIAAQKHALQCVQHGGDEPVFMYRFDHFNPKMYGLFGMKFPFFDASHVADICFLFAVGIFGPFEFTEDDKKLIEEMTTRFANFAKNSDPNGDNLENWLPVTKEHPQRHLQINVESRMSNEFYNGRPLWCIQRKEENNK